MLWWVQRCRPTKDKQACVSHYVPAHGRPQMHHKLTLWQTVEFMEVLFFFSVLFYYVDMLREMVLEIDGQIFRKYISISWAVYSTALETNLLAEGYFSLLVPFKFVSFFFSLLVPPNIFGRQRKQAVNIMPCYSQHHCKWKPIVTRVIVFINLIKKSHNRYGRETKADRRFSQHGTVFIRLNILSPLLND